MPAVTSAFADLLRCRLRTMDSSSQDCLSLVCGPFANFGGGLAGTANTIMKPISGLVDEILALLH